uniref:Uncharacterized protein n=1 Tax=viral metagenome TaxID=1070528 RepID=A0A6M3JD96_9ZZZZ
MKRRDFLQNAGKAIVGIPAAVFGLKTAIGKTKVADGAPMKIKCVSIKESELGRLSYKCDGKPVVDKIGTFCDPDVMKQLNKFRKDNDMEPIPRDLW